jgi:DNA-binding PucR family transcriptional regulator
MLYIHRHTFKNRLEKMEQLFTLSLNGHYTRLQLSLELLMYDLFAD